MDTPEASDKPSKKSKLPKRRKSKKGKRKKTKAADSPSSTVVAPTAGGITGVKVIDDFVAANGLILEAMAGAVVAAFVIVLLWGRSANRSIPLQFLDHFRGLLERQFKQLAVVSDGTAEANAKAKKGEQSDSADDFPFLTEANDVFKFFATGRRHVRGLVATFELVPRHNLLMYLYALFTGMKDSLTIDLRMEPDSARNMVLAVLPRKRVRTLMQQDHGLREYASEVSRDRLGQAVAKQLAVAADARVTGMKLLSEPLPLGKALEVGPSTGLASGVLGATKLTPDPEDEEDEEDEEEGAAETALNVMLQYAKGDKAEGIPAAFKQLLITDHAKNAAASQDSPMTTFAVQMRIELPSGSDWPSKIERLVQLALQLTDAVVSVRGDQRELAACRKQRESKLTEVRREREQKQRELDEAQKQREKEARLAELERTNPKKAKAMKKKEQKRLAKAMQKSGMMPGMGM